MFIIGRNLSPFSRRCVISLKLLGLEFERRELATGPDFDEILSSNPVGRVPALVLDDGRVIYDSASILDWIDQQVGAERALIPLGGEARIDVLALTTLALATMEKAVAVVYEINHRPTEKVHPDWLARLNRQAQGGLTALEAKLGDNSHFHGDRVTQADITAAVLYDFASVMTPALLADNALPRLAAHLARMNRLPAFQETDLAPFRK